MSIFGKIGGAIIGGVEGLVKGGPIGAITGAATGLFGGGSRPPAPVPAGTLPGGATGTAFGVPGLFGFTHLSGAGGNAVSPVNGACPKGYHLNKHALPQSRSHGAVPKLSICVRNRHMNPMNGRAVARAARRLHSGEKLLRRIYRVEGKAHGKIRPRVGRKR